MKLSSVSILSTSAAFLESEVFSSLPGTVSISTARALTLGYGGSRATESSAAAQAPAAASTAVGTLARGGPLCSFLLGAEWALLVSGPGPPCPRRGVPLRPGQLTWEGTAGWLACPAAVPAPPGMPVAADTFLLRCWLCRSVSCCFFYSHLNPWRWVLRRGKTTLCFSSSVTDVTIKIKLLWQIHYRIQEHELLGGFHLRTLQKLWVSSHSNCTMSNAAIEPVCWEKSLLKPILSQISQNSIWQLFHKTPMLELYLSLYHGLLSTSGWAFTNKSKKSNT